MRTIFTTTVLKDKDKNATGIEVPAEIVEELGNGKKPHVKVTINGYTYRSTVAVMGGQFMLPLSSENRVNAMVNAGDIIEVKIDIDTEPRIVIVPTDLEIALSKISGATAKFGDLSYSIRKEHVRQVESAKAQETRERRIKIIVDKISES